jgi:DNA repair protein RecO
MSHHIYQTKAFVIDSVDVGEANKLLTLFTADLGLILVSVQGVRVMKSKLRQSVQDLSFSKVALVRGKEYWRLTSADKLISLYDKRIPLYIRRFMSSTLQFVKRLTTGEAKHEELFDLISKLFTFCFENSKYFSETKNHTDTLRALACITEFRILESLGYGSDDTDFDEIRDVMVWNVEMLESLQSNPEKIEKIKKHITHALLSSHL